MDHAVAQCRELLDQSALLFRGLADSHRAFEPQPGAKTAGWLIGHLCVTGDFARRLCGRPPICPKEWRALFNPGSQPSTDPESYPAMTALQDTFRAVYTDLCDAAVAADAATLANENPYAPGREHFPTAGDFVAYLAAGHLGYHLGQLATWRAAAGMGPLSAQS
jgi:hypothetical protein